MNYLLKPHLGSSGDPFMKTITLDCFNSYFNLGNTLSYLTQKFSLKISNSDSILLLNSVTSGFSSLFQTSLVEEIINTVGMISISKKSPISSFSSISMKLNMISYLSLLIAQMVSQTLRLYSCYLLQKTRIQNLSKNEPSNLFKSLAYLI